MDNLLKLLVILALVTVFGCGEDKLESCDPAARNGTYVLLYDEKSGNCGPIDDSVVHLSGEHSGLFTPGGDTCSIEKTIVENNGCTLSDSVACINDEKKLEKMTIVTTQETADASRISGTADITIGDESDDENCRSTYHVEYVRK